MYVLFPKFLKIFNGLQIHLNGFKWKDNSNRFNIRYKIIVFVRPLFEQIRKRVNLIKEN